MAKLRKQRRRKVYRYNVNRKRLRNKIRSVGSIACKEIKDAWEQRKSVETNLREMGLSYDPNKTIKIPNKKKKLSSNEEEKEELSEEIIEQSSEKASVAQKLEAEAKAPRESKMRLPEGQVEWLSYLMKKYKKDYRAMARDKKNYNQETWKSIRQKIRRFKAIPQQYQKFLQENNFKDEDFDEEEISDDEW